jgi:hypothetical protein
VQFLEFKKLTLDEIDFVRPIYHKYYDGSCDMTIGGTFMWREFYNSEYAFEDNTLFFRITEDGKTTYEYPIGPDEDRALKKLGKVDFSFLSKPHMEKIRALYPDAEVIEERDYFEYIYDASSLITLSGKKLSGQRNHVNRFKRLYPNYEFIEINENNIEKAIEFFSYYDLVASKKSESAIEDREKTIELLNNFKRYYLLGGMLLVDGKVVGASLGEKVGNTLIVHVEKALIEYSGVYPTLTNCFNKRFGTDVEFINREDDAGDEGLRKNKLSYHPIKLFEKYRVIMKK